MPKTKTDYALDAFARAKEKGRKKWTTVPLTKDEWSIVKPFIRRLIKKRKD